MSANPQNIAESIFGGIDWIDFSTGFARCPGEHLHSHRTGKRDCRVNLDGAPTLFCFHTSCTGFVEEGNKRLRRALGAAGDCQLPYVPTPEDAERRRQRAAEEAMKLRAVEGRSQLLRQFSEAGGTDALNFLCTHSPSDVLQLGNPEHDWRLLLQLFAPEDVVWCGEVNDSGRPENAGNFRTVSEWLVFARPLGCFTCPATFKPGTISRCTDAVALRRYLVVESDSLTKIESAAVFRWLQQTLRLRAVVCTAGKSLHGWFDFPTPEHLAQLKIILPALGCDPKLFGASQPCRMPGAWRPREGGKRLQTLLYLDLNREEKQ